ncbi:MAG: aspartate aminotransferase family protein [Caldilineales bacterium]|nr:aspartate aminotransferase family protein [Caldilineales bacterium]
MNPTTLFDLESAHTSGVYPKRPLAIVRGQGARVLDADGREYIDCVAGQGSANLGHAHPAIVAAISEQAQCLISCPEIFYNDRRAELLAVLARVAPGNLDRAFLCNSGAEAIEAALKFARLGTGRRQIVACKRGFHGRTMGALSATWEPKYRAPFEPLVADFEHVAFNDIDGLVEAVSAQTAAVLVEIVQGEGGVNQATAEFLQMANDLCQASGALLIVDEIQTGYGRTGKLFACEHFRLEPDLMAISKSMAGGLPMGACLIGPRVGELAKMSHGSTFGGNPLACAVALATLQVMETEALPERASKLGEHLSARLAEIDSPLIREIRGLGLMIGIDLRVKVTPVLKALQDRGVLALPAGSTVLRLLPPLVITEDELDIVVSAIREVLAEIGD